MRPGSPWVMLALALMLLFALAGFDAYLDYQAIGEAERARLIRQTEIVNANLSERLQSTNDALEALADDLPWPMIDMRVRKQANASLERFVVAMSGAESIAVVDAEGSVVAASSGELIGLNFREEDRFHSIKNGSDPATLYLSPPFLTSSKKYAMSVAKVFIGDRGEFNGYIVAVFEPEYFGVLLRSLIYMPDMRVGIVHSDGKVVFRVPDNENITGLDIGKNPDSVFNLHIKSGRAGSFHVSKTTAFRDVRMIAYRTIQPLRNVADKSLVVFASRDLWGIHENWRRKLAETLLLLGVIAATAIVGMFFYQRRRKAYQRLQVIQQAQRAKADERIRKLNVELENKVVQRTAELTRANEELTLLSRRDALTGLANRLATNERLQVEFLRMKRSGEQYAILIMDIDWFKRVNDTYGHGVGDEVLRQFAVILAGAVRETDFVARNGGEEFLALLPGTELEGAVQVAEKIRCGIESARMPSVGQVTISIGVAMATPDDADDDQALVEADRRLYLAKENGRNQVNASGSIGV